MKSSLYLAIAAAVLAIAVFIATPSFGAAPSGSADWIGAGSKICSNVGNCDQQPGNKCTPEEGLPTCQAGTSCWQGCANPNTGSECKPNGNYNCWQISPISCNQGAEGVCNLACTCTPNGTMSNCGSNLPLCNMSP